MLKFVKDFFCIYGDDHVIFVLYSVFLLYYVFKHFFEFFDISFTFLSLVFAVALWRSQAALFFHISLFLNWYLCI
jgi:hypothetical protein